MILTIIALIAILWLFGGAIKSVFRFFSYVLIGGIVMAIIKNLAN